MTNTTSPSNTSVSLGMPRQRTMADYRNDGFDDPKAWTMDALCGQTDPEAFFPEKGGSTRDAKRICGSCEVRSLCLGWALENDEKFGIWGGLSERERRKLRKATLAAKGITEDSSDDFDDLDDEADDFEDEIAA